MKRSLLFVSAALILLTSCNYKRVKGNGHITSQTRSLSRAEAVKLSGSYDVEITQGSPASLRIEGDDNLLKYIITDEENGKLTIRTKDHINLVSENPIKVYITTEKIEDVQLAGSGNIVAKNKLTAGEKLRLKIAGAGDISVETNTPVIDAEIAGSGSITIGGETREQTIRIAGMGDYNGDGLKSEKATVKIAGSGDVKVFADVLLDISVAGSGSIYYKGNATVKQSIAGSGEVKKLE